MNDNDLVIQLKYRNREAFAYLMEKYKGLVWSITYRMSQNKSVAEDLYQEVFYRIWKSIEEFRGDSRLSTWIGSVAFNVSSDYLRKKKSIQLFEEERKDELRFYENNSETPDDYLQKKELMDLLKETIESLPQSYKLVITLFHLEEFSIKEVSEITGMPEGTIKSYLNRGRKAIREKILRYFPEFQDSNYESIV